MIVLVNLPGECAGCLTGIMDNGVFLENYVALDFRMGDSSTSTISFCRDCALKFDMNEIHLLREMIIRGFVIMSMNSVRNKNSRIEATRLRLEASNDWNAFARKYLPLKGKELKAFNNCKHPFVEKVNGEGVYRFSELPFPILEIVMWRTMDPNGRGLKMTTREKVEAANG